MTYYTDTAARNVGTSNRAATFFGALLTKMKTRRLYRETFNGLSNLTNRELADLGLSRSELRRVSWEAANNAH
ncbi:MAG: DUF1127 domain-containing protein [Sulfitobacter sp.]